MNRKFFQLRQMTRNLDDEYQQDANTYNQMVGKKYTPNFSKLENDRQVLKEWEFYKRTRLSGIVDQTLESKCFKICICDFIKKQKISLEFWIKVAYDIFHEDQKGKLVRMNFWRSMRRKSFNLEYDLKQKKWPEGWKYLEKEPCLNLELLKLYEQYIPIRPFIAEKLNTMTKIMCDVRRMPMLREDRFIEFDLSGTTWFPPICMCGPIILEQLSNSDNYFCHQLIKFITDMKPIIFPILDFFRQSKTKGRVINLFGKQYEFVLEALYSLKACCGQSINCTQGSMKIKKNYKCPHSYKMHELTCSIMLTTLTQADIASDVLNDIQNNISSGYSAFVYSDQNQKMQQDNKRLVFILSELKLQFKFLKKGISFYQLPDAAISSIINGIDYSFLTYYSNILFNKCMIVQQHCSQRKPFYQIMICMWTYVLPMYFKEDIPNLASDSIFGEIHKIAEDIQIDLGLSSLQLSELESEQEQAQQMKSTENIQDQIKADQFEINDDCIIIEDSPKKYIKI